LLWLLVLLLLALALFVGDCGLDVGVVDREFWFPIADAAKQDATDKADLRGLRRAR
jgi:hypothetical protein